MWISAIVNVHATFYLVLTLDRLSPRINNFMMEKKTNAAAMQCAPEDARIKEGWYSVQPKRETGTRKPRHVKSSEDAMKKKKMNVQMKDVSSPLIYPCSRLDVSS